MKVGGGQSEWDRPIRAVNDLQVACCVAWCVIDKQVGLRKQCGHHFLIEYVALHPSSPCASLMNSGVVLFKKSVRVEM